MFFFYENFLIKGYKSFIDLYLLLKIILPPIKPKIFIVMKKLNFSLLMILSFTFLLACDEKPDLKLKRAFVETGSISKDTSSFISNGAFKVRDSAVGTVDTLFCKPNDFNGYTTPNEMVYVFAGGKIPAEVAKLKPKDLSDKLQSINWNDDYTYNLLRDAEFCMDFKKFQYYIREAGKTKRQKATLLPGITVYRFKNLTYLEDYNKYVHAHCYLRNQKKEVNYFEANKITNTKYDVSTTSPTLKVNATTGLIDYGLSTATPLGRTDKVYLLPKTGAGQKYRFRVVYIVHKPESIKRNFSTDEKELYSLDNIRQVRWTKELNDNIIPKHLEKTIRGYKCVKCKPESKIRSLLGDDVGEVIPPLPQIENGY
jgi:hypothetical protein